MSDESEVLEANGAFYASFASGDAAAMDALWARGSPVACCHPGWEPLLGRARVLASFQAIFAAGPPPVRCESASVHLLGEVAYVICTEQLPGGQLAATNVFIREERRFRLVHHHAGPVARQPAEQRDPKVLN
jgi:ketosteroid isomerase-like protein